jgi:hypothetical protein
MNIKMIAALALVSAALSSAAPAQAQVSLMHEHRNACHCDAVASHKRMVMAHVAKMPPVLQDTAPQTMHDDDWPNDLILGSFQTHQPLKAATVAA